MFIVREIAPGAFEPIAICPTIIGPDGAQYPWQIIDLWDDAELDAIGIYKVEETDTPAGKRPVSHTFARIDGKVSYVPTYEDIPPSPSPSPTKAELGGYAANLRYEREVGGVAWGDYVIQSDRESQSKLLAEFVAISAGLRADPSPWKFANNQFASISNADMATICLAVRAHVAAMFALEETVQTQIDSGTITTLAEIDAAFV